MSPISPIPTGRITDLSLRSRLTSQLLSDQQELFRLQTQISTGQRIQLPSEDAPAALRAISLQRLIERKGQASKNLTTSQGYLAATDTALNTVSNLLSDARGAALSVVDTISSDTQRDAVAEELQRIIEQLVDAGNQSYRGRFLFSGSRTADRPFADSGRFVQYSGNEGVLQSYNDVDLLTATNAHGQEAFGVLSDAVRGTVDLDPPLLSTTLLRDLHRLGGVDRGHITISDGTNVSVVDLSKAETIADVVQAIEANPPASRTVQVTVTPTGLNIELDAAGGGDLTITEVADGTTARDLGILEENGALTGPVVGADVNPGLRLTTRLTDIAFDRASGIRIANGDETFVLQFDDAETLEDLLNVLNGSDAGLLAQINSAGTGIDVRSRWSGADFSIGENGGTTASDLGIRTFALDSRLSSLNHGQGVEAADGVDFTIVRNDGVALDIDVSGAATIGDVVDRINNHTGNQPPGATVMARLTEFGNGIELVDSSPNGVNGLGDPIVLSVRKSVLSEAAVQLGLVPPGQDEIVASLSVGGAETLAGRDTNAQETNGVFNSLLRLQQAVRTNNVPEIERMLEMLSQDETRVTFARSEIGARQQGLDALQERSSAEEIELRRALSNEIDVDLTEAISDLAARQFAYQASLQASANLLQLSLLNFL